MPRYTSKQKRNQKRERRRVRHAVPRDKRHLMHWAVRGNHDDYARFRKHIGKIADRAPSYVSQDAMAALKQTDRRQMLAALGKEPFGGSWFTDGLSWAIDQVPNDPEWDWAKGLGQAALKPFRGSDLNEQDEMYARLVDESYDRENETIGDWKRQPEFDSNYISVFDNADGHRFIGVRGTQMNLQDLAQDLKIMQDGAPQDLISEELRRVLDHTDPGTIVDTGAHSLGTSLLTQAFETDDSLQDRIRQSYLFNPAMSPFAENVTSKYEADDRVRYFIDLMDPVSVGGIGDRGPATSSTGPTGASTRSSPTASPSGPARSRKRSQKSKRRRKRRDRLIPSMVLSTLAGWIRRAWQALWVRVFFSTSETPLTRPRSVSDSPKPAKKKPRLTRSLTWEPTNPVYGDGNVRMYR